MEHFSNHVYECDRNAAFSLFSPGLFSIVSEKLTMKIKGVLAYETGGCNERELFIADATRA